MSRKQLTKIEAKLKKDQDREFRAWFKIVRSKLKRAVKDKAVFNLLESDLKRCNNSEIMHYLMSRATFDSKETYLEEVNNWLRFEYHSENYQKADRLLYNGSNFDEVSEIIRKQHRLVELRNKIFELGKQSDIINT